MTDGIQAQFTGTEEQVEYLAKFIDELSVSYTRLSGYGLQEVIDLAVLRFGVPAELIYGGPQYVPEHLKNATEEGN
jgi:hypothetical protein